MTNRERGAAASLQFRQLTPEEEAAFRQWARDNYPTGTPVNPLWHPVVRAECAAINAGQ
jgi:hypothetical protein